MVYGAYGYTGRLVVGRAAEEGLHPVVAGRDPEAVDALADEVGFEGRAFALDDPERASRALEGVGAVLHCAGPFEDTARPMAEACLRAGVHYLDITGEIAVFEALAGLDGRARERGILLLPGVGFDVVPTDCQAAHVAARLRAASPSARPARLVLAFRSSGGVSRGTARTALRRLGRPALVRREGEWVPVPLGARVRRFDFGRGPEPAVLIPWGDLATAPRSTGIDDVAVYAALPARARALLRLAGALGPLARTRPVRAVAEWWIGRRPAGPDAAARARGRTVVRAEAEDDEGLRAVSRLHGPEGYTFTALAAVEALRRALAGRAERADREPGPAGGGFRTPSQAFGADFVLSLPGVRREDLPPGSAEDPLPLGSVEDLPSGSANEGV